MILSLLIPFLILIMSVAITYLALLATLYAVRSKDVYKFDKLAVLTILIVITNFIANYLLGLIKGAGIIDSLIGALITFLIAYFFAKEYLKMDQRKAITFGIYFVVISLVLSIAFGLLLFTIGISFFNLNFP